MTALIIYAVLSIAAFLALWICCKMASEPYPCGKCDREYCEGCEYWREWTGNGK